MDAARHEGLSGVLLLFALVPGCFTGMDSDGAPGTGGETTAQTTAATTMPGTTSPATSATAPTVTGATSATTSGGDPTTDPEPSSTTGDPGSSGGSEASTTAGGDPLLFEEIDGIVAVEAEHVSQIDPNGTERLWYIFDAADQPSVDPDPDPPHWDSASGSACLEGLPDTRVTHDDQLISGVNFYGSGGQGPILRYRVHFNNPGTYWARVRAYSTGTEDNGVHLGVDGTWPASGERIQWCNGKNEWTWSGAQRTDANHCGEENLIFIEILEAGEHEIAFSMREDGFEMDKWMLTDDPAVFPEGEGPAEAVYAE